MSYGLAIRLKSGIVFASDSRTNAGVDYVRTYSKMHTFCSPKESVYVLLTAGNLATTQAVVNTIKREIESPDSKFKLHKATHLFDVAHYIGELSRHEQLRHGKAVSASGADVSASFIVGGQIAGNDPEIYLVYPEGNYISGSFESPFLQIGETKYGKPILDRIINPDLSLEDGARCALVSLDSTMRSNVSVGPPLELAVYHAGSLDHPRHLVLKPTSSLYQALQTEWNKGVQDAFSRLPRFDWEQ